MEHTVLRVGKASQRRAPWSLEGRQREQASGSGRRERPRTRQVVRDSEACTQDAAESPQRELGAGSLPGWGR